MRVDYHFHPNLQAKNSKHRLAAVWKAFDRHRIDAVICSEHTFKNAPNAYRQLLSSKPQACRTHVFAGAELVTSDGMGIDVIAFAAHDWYDEHPRLLEPFAMPLSEMVSYLERSGLHYFIPHPYILRNPLKDLYPTRLAMREFLGGMPAYEAFNGCFLGVERLMSIPPFGRLLSRVRRTLRECTRPPKDWLPAMKHRFLAIGSDAHHPSEIGLCVEIPCPHLRDRSRVFHALTTNTDIRTVHFSRKPSSFLQLCWTAWTTFTEWMMRKYWKLRRWTEHLAGGDEPELAMEMTPEQTWLAEGEISDDGC